MRSLRPKLFLCLVITLACPAARGQGAYIVSVEPREGQVGTSLDITVTGTEMVVFGEDAVVHFEQAWSYITHDPVNLIEYNVLVTTIHIPSDTPPGEKSIVVETMGMTYRGNFLFRVVGGTTEDPRIVDVSPSSGAAGETLTVQVTGAETHFDSSSQVEFSPAGIRVNQVRADSPTRLTVSVAIDSTTSPGTHSVTVSTGSEVATGGVFRVAAPAVAVDPDEGMQGRTLTLLRVSGGPGGFTSQTGVSLGPGISIGSIVALSGTTLELRSVSIAADAPVGPRSLTITNPAFTASGAFLVLQGPDTRLLSVSPAHGDRGHPGLSLSLLGHNTHFDDPDVTISFGDRHIWANPVAAADGTHLGARVMIADSVAEGWRDVTVSLGLDAGCGTCEEVRLQDAFEVTSPGALTGVTPDALNTGETVTVSITGTDGHFADGVTTLHFDPSDGLEAVSVTVLDAGRLSALIRVDASASGELRDVTAVTGTEVALGPGLLDVFHPEITAVAPSTLYPGSTGFRFILYGQDIPFDDNTSVSFSGEGVHVDAVSFEPASPDQLYLTVTVEESAPLGPRDVTVIAGDIHVTAESICTVMKPSLKDKDGGCSTGGYPMGMPWLLLLAVLLWISRRPHRSR